MLSTRRSNAFPSDGIAWDACWNKVQTTTSFYEAFGGHFLFAVCKERVRIAGMQEQVSPCGGVRRRQVSTGSGSSNQYDINLKHKELLASWKSCATTKNYALWPWETPNAITFTRHFTHCSILIFGVFKTFCDLNARGYFSILRGLKNYDSHFHHGGTDWRQAPPWYQGPLSQKTLRELFLKDQKLSTLRCHECTFPKWNPILIASLCALLRTRLKWDQFAALMQLFCASRTSRQRGAARCERLQHHRAVPQRTHEQLAALQGNYTPVRLIIPPPASSLHPPLPFFHRPFCSCYFKNITLLQELRWFKPSASSQSLIRLTISIMELMAFITRCVCSQTGSARLFGLIPHARIMTGNYSRRLTAFTRRPVILKAGWWSRSTVPFWQPRVPDRARCVCLRSAINEGILPTTRGVCRAHAPTAATTGAFSLDLSIISIKEI